MPRRFDPGVNTGSGRVSQRVAPAFDPAGIIQPDSTSMPYLEVIVSALLGSRHRSLQAPFYTMTRNSLDRGGH